MDMQYASAVMPLKPDIEPTAAMQVVKDRLSMIDDIWLDNEHQIGFLVMHTIENSNALARLVTQLCPDGTVIMLDSTSEGDGEVEFVGPDADARDRAEIKWEREQISEALARIDRLEDAIEARAVASSTDKRPRWLVVRNKDAWARYTTHVHADTPEAALAWVEANDDKIQWREDGMSGPYDHCMHEVFDSEGVQVLEDAD